MSDRNLSSDNRVHELKLGRSFDPTSRAAFHSIRYDFKPASVDTQREAVFEVGEGHQVSVTVPHVQSSGTSHTVYRGNKKPCPKECVLIIDHDTGTYTLEKLSNNIQLKKTRIEGSSRQSQQRPMTPVEVAKQRPSSPSKPKGKQASPSSMKGSSPVFSNQPDRDIEMMESTATVLGDVSDSSSSSSSDDSDSETEAPQNSAPSNDLSSSGNWRNFSTKTNLLSQDLQLSESGSDSD